MAALHHGGGGTNRMYKEPPFDVMYGFRGRRGSVDLLTPYEMLLHYSMERILPRTNPRAESRAVWTEEGEAYRWTEVWCSPKSVSGLLDYLEALWRAYARLQQRGETHARQRPDSERAPRLSSHMDGSRGHQQHRTTATHRLGHGV